MYPQPLDEIIELFEFLPEDERREALVTYADGAKNYAPIEGAEYDLVDVRKDEECTDTVGIHLTVSDTENVSYKVSLGDKVQTLTRAMTAILCKGLEGATIKEVMDLPADFVPRIAGGELVRVRSQTVYYVLTRMKGAAQVYQKRKRASEITD